MSHSIHSADRATHLKIVIAALTIGIAIVGSVTMIRFNSKPASIETAAVFKAGKPVIVTSSTAPIAR
jgi:hypothetical protein